MARVSHDASSSPKQSALDAIARAQVELARAVEEMDTLPALDVHAIALAAHALNNFLTVSRGVIDLLVPVLRDHPDPDIAVWIEGLSHATDLMTHTASQLMNNAVAVPTTPRLDDVDLPRLVERACAYYRRHSEFMHLHLRFTTVTDVPSVRTDRVLVAAVLDNLLSNAVKYSRAGCRIWVDVRRDRDGVVCTVRDEGPGMSSEEQARLFQPGVRLGAIPGGGEPSHGYGLAVAKRFADRLGGELTCTSAPGQGTTFSLWLPSEIPSQ